MRSYYFPIIAVIGVLLGCPLYAQQEDVPPAVVTTEIDAEDAAEDSETAETAETDDAAENAQETAAEAESADDDEAAETENIAIDLDDPDDIDLDEQTYEEDDDDFVPTREIPADTPIAFPSNI